MQLELGRTTEEELPERSVYCPIPLMSGVLAEDQPFLKRAV